MSGQAATRAEGIVADPRWQDVVARRRAADGAFVYAVATTGVFCRPSCPARRARPENVRFFSGPAAARAAGFRPCLRCRPEAGEGGSHAPAIAEACRRIEAAAEPIPLDRLAAPSGLSPFHFHRLFKEATGLTPRGYAAARRAGRVRDELARPGATVTAALYEAGYGASSRFYAESGTVLGMAPKRFRDGGADEAVAFAVAPCSLGRVLVARSRKGVCAVLLGADEAELARDLRRRFPRATIAEGDADFADLLARVVRLVAEPGRGHDLPLDLRGTAFQHRVWTALGRIPPGRTASYAAIAAAIGRPAATRAVAQACAANPVAVAVPCHRVVRQDGALSGYRWGVERKRALLDRERDAAT